MRALLADDQVWLRSALRLLLEHEANIEVVGEVASVHSLPSLINQLHPDLLFLDWQLTGFDTNSSRRRIINMLRVCDPALYIIALTSDDWLQNCLRQGANALINRSEAPDHILATVQQAASQRASFRAE